MLKHLLRYPGLLISTSGARNLAEKERYPLAKIHFSFLSIALLLGAYAVGGGLVLYSLVIANSVIMYLTLRDMKKEMAQQQPE